MGTRNLTAVVLDGKFRIAQYGQWDGYPEGQGKIALSFLHEMDRARFESKLRAARFATQSDFDAINADIEKIKGSPLAEGGKYAQFSRDRGAKILAIVDNAEPGILLADQHRFAADSLFCEWAYVIDLDRNTFEVYKGFNKTPLADGERFKGVVAEDASDGYFPVRLVKSYDLAALPTVEAFIAEFTSPATAEDAEEVEA